VSAIITTFKAPFMPADDKSDAAYGSTNRATYRTAKREGNEINKLILEQLNDFIYRRLYKIGILTKIKFLPF